MAKTLTQSLLLSSPSRRADPFFVHLHGVLESIIGHLSNHDRQGKVPAWPIVGIRICHCGNGSATPDRRLVQTD